MKKETTETMAAELAEMEVNMMGVEELKTLALDALTRKWYDRGDEAVASAYNYMKEGYVQ